MDGWPPPARRGIERRSLWEALLWTLAALLLEVGIGWAYAGSVALLSDAGHVAHHLGAILVAFAAVKRGERAQSWEAQSRIETRAAAVVGVLLVLAAPPILWQAVVQLREPATLRGFWMVGTAVVGAAINGRVLWVLARGTGILIAGVMLHALWDLIASVVVVVGSVAVWATGRTAIDAILGLVLGLFIIGSGLHLVRESRHPRNTHPLPHTD